MDKEKLWKSILGELEVTISSTYYNTFFPNTHIKNISEERNNIEIGCPNTSSKNVLQNRYKDSIETLIKNRTGTKFNLDFSIENTKSNKHEPKNTPLFQNLNTIKETQEEKFKPADNNKRTGLVKDYTFDNFIMGSNNRLAYTVAKAIAENPGISYNPFLIYSGVGLGKTHLLQAIGNEILKRNSQSRVLYCTGQEFLNDLMDQLQNRRDKGGTIRNFKNKFMNNDVWLIDDVQIIAGRDSTQEEFYFIFNTLYLNKKQIVLSSDRHPSEIAKLQDRISSRFRMGMIADIQMPDVDVRNAILRSKRDQFKIEIDNETIDYIAQNVNTNIRELEGALIQVVTHAKSMRENLNIETARFVLGKSLIKKEEKNIKPTKVIQEVAKFYDVEIREIKGKRRSKEIVLPRQVIMYLLKEINQLPFMNIGEILGGRDHTTIIYGAEKIKKEIENGNFRLKRDVSTIKENILNK